MYKTGDLIIVNGILYVYISFEDGLHKVSVVDIDDGVAIDTHNIWYFTPEEFKAEDLISLAKGINEFLWEFNTYEFKNQYDDRRELTKEIKNQLEDFNILKQIINLYAEELTDEELFDKLGEVLKL